MSKLTKGPRAPNNVIFRRYRRTKDGRVLDAWAYGLRAWPIRLGGD